jgi:chromosome partitioning protein
VQRLPFRRSQTRRGLVSGLKGGVGKTQVSLNLAAAITRRGGRVLLVELDPQGSATHQVTGLIPKQLERTVGTVLVECLDGRDPVDAVQETVLRVQDPELEIPDFARECWGALDILPANSACAGLQLGNHHLRVLAEVLDAADKAYDLVLYDSAPSISNLTLAGMYATERVLAVTQPSLGSINGVRQLVQEFVTPVQKFHPPLVFSGAIVNGYDSRKSEHQRRLTELHENLGGFVTEGGKLCPAVIPDRAVVEQAEGARLPIWAMGGPSAAAIADQMDTTYLQMIYSRRAA